MHKLFDNTRKTVMWKIMTLFRRWPISFNGVWRGSRVARSGFGEGNRGVSMSGQVVSVTTSMDKLMVWRAVSPDCWHPKHGYWAGSGWVNGPRWKLVYAKVNAIPVRVFWRYICSGGRFVSIEISTFINARITEFLSEEGTEKVFFKSLTRFAWFGGVTI